MTDTSQVLRGQLNGEALVEAFSFADELEDTTSRTTGTYSEYVVITDDTGAIQSRSRWNGPRSMAPPTRTKRAGPITDVRPLPDLTVFLETWDTPGMIFSASSDWVDDHQRRGVCSIRSARDLEERVRLRRPRAYEDALYTGLRHVCQLRGHRRPPMWSWRPARRKATSSSWCRSRPTPIATSTPSTASLPASIVSGDV